MWNLRLGSFSSSAGTKRFFHEGARTGALVGALVAALAVFGGVRPARGEMTVYPREGSQLDDTERPSGPGLVLMGGNYDVDAAVTWMHGVVRGSSRGPRDRAGDVIVLRQPAGRDGGDDAYTRYFLRRAPFQSVQTVVLDDPSPDELVRAAALVDKAEAVFFGGGDQRLYVGWQGPLLQAVQRVYERGGVLGGTSAGAVLFGEHVNDAIAQYRFGSVVSAGAVENPYQRSISFSKNVFRVPVLRSALVDTHFAARDRFGRLGAFMARLLGDRAEPSGGVLGIGIDEDSALLVDRFGIATLARQRPSSRGAFFLRAGRAERLVRGEPLVYRDIAVMRLDGDGQTFDLRSGCGDGVTSRVSIDGRSPEAYDPPDPYSAGGERGGCIGPASWADDPSVPRAPDGGADVRDAGPGARPDDRDAGGGGVSRPDGRSDGRPETHATGWDDDLPDPAGPDCQVAPRTLRGGGPRPAALAVLCGLLSLTWAVRRRARTRDTAA